MAEVTSDGSVADISSAWKGAKTSETAPFTVDTLARFIVERAEPMKERNTNLIVVDLSIWSVRRTRP